MQDDSKIIDNLGGTTRTAEICEITPAAVSQWRTNGIPRAQRRYLRLKYPHAFSDALKPNAEKSR